MVLHLCLPLSDCGCQARYLAWVSLAHQTGATRHDIDKTLQLSSTVHLTVLTLLRENVYSTSGMFHWRLGGILVLGVMILVGLVPTIHDAWGQSSGLPNEYTFGISARCFWTLHPDHVNVDGILSMLILILSYARKIGSLFLVSRGRLRWLCRAWPEYILERLLIGKPVENTVLHGWAVHCSRSSWCHT